MEKAPQRIAILGNAGSGKSRLATQIAAATDLPLIHLDQHFWLPGWRKRPNDAWESWHRQTIQTTAWILDGNFARTLTPRAVAADLIVFFDIPVWLCLWRVLKRVVTNYRRVRPDMPPDCPERFDFAFFVYVWSWRRDRRNRTLEAVSVAGGRDRMIVISKTRDVANVWTALGVSPPRG